MNVGFRLRSVGLTLRLAARRDRCSRYVLSALLPVLLSVVSSLAPSTAFAEVTAADVKARLQRQLGMRPDVEVRDTALRGVFTIGDVRPNKCPLYVDEQVRYFGNEGGPGWKQIATGTRLAGAELDQWRRGLATALAEAGLPLGAKGVGPSFVLISGNDCPYCIKLERALADTRKDLAYSVVPTWVNEENRAYSEAVMCAAGDRSAMWAAMMIGGTRPARAVAQCGTLYALQRELQCAYRTTMSDTSPWGTPWVVLPNGTAVRAPDAQRIAALVANGERFEVAQRLAANGSDPGSSSPRQSGAKTGAVAAPATAAIAGNDYRVRMTSDADLLCRAKSKQPRPIDEQYARVKVPGYLNEQDAYKRKDILRSAAAAYDEQIQQARGVRSVVFDALSPRSPAPGIPGENYAAGAFKLDPYSSEKDAFMIQGLIGRRQLSGQCYLSFVNGEDFTFPRVPESEGRALNQIALQIGAGLSSVSGRKDLGSLVFGEVQEAPDGALNVRIKRIELYFKGQQYFSISAD